MTVAVTDRIEKTILLHASRSRVWRALANANEFGAWPYIYGTLMSSFLALLLAVPVSIGTAIFLAELAPQWMRTPLSFV